MTVKPSWPAKRRRVLMAMTAGITQHYLAHSISAQASPLPVLISQSGSSGQSGLATSQSLATSGQPISTNSQVSAYTSLERFLRQVQSASVQVSLRQIRRDGENARLGKASLQFQRPDRFRWDSQAPNDQLVLADGESLWIYDRDLEQVTVRPLRAALEGLPTGLLIGSERLLSSFKFEVLPDKAGLQWLKATALERQGLTDHINLGFSQGMPQVMQITDLGGRGMRYEFSNWQLAPVAAAQFRFVMPKGIDLIRMAR